MSNTVAAAPWRSRLLAATALCAIIHAALYATRWAGDAEIHLIYAENAANGRWFQFNHGQVTQGSTSALWTLLLASAWRVGGVAAASWAASLACLVSYFSAVAITWRLGERVASWQAGALAALLLAANPSIAANSLLGMENCTGAALLGAAWLVTLSPWTRRTPWCWGALVGLAFLCRPDALVPIAAQALYIALRLWRSPSSPRARWVGAALLAGALVVPFFVFQHSITGRWMPSSGVSRVLLSRRTAVHLGPIWIHLRLLTRLIGPYLPISLGFVWALTRSSLQTPERRCLGGATALTLALHTFVFGAAHASRYFLLSFPAFFVLGAIGVIDIVSALSERSRALAPVAAVACCAWMSLVYGADEYLRLTSSMRGAPMGYHLDLFRNRRAFTDTLLAQIAWSDARPAQLALTEVQLRGFTDERVVVRSLDGRVDQELLDVTGPGGCPDYAAYFRRVRIDALSADQACDCPSSLLCALERRSATHPTEPVLVGGVTFRYTGYDRYWRVVDLGPR